MPESQEQVREAIKPRTLKRAYQRNTGTKQWTDSAPAVVERSPPSKVSGSPETQPPIGGDAAIEADEEESIIVPRGDGVRSRADTGSAYGRSLGGQGAIITDRKSS